MNLNEKKILVNYNKIRRLHWTGQKKKLKKDFDINIDFFSAPYTFLKTFLYIELSSLLVFLIQNTSVTPNLITILYALLGIFGGIFLGSGNENLILTGILIFFFKGVLDWTDGLIARLRKETSNLGSLLDEWAGLVGSYSFIIGFGFYLFDTTNQLYFIFISIFIIFIRSLDLKNFFYQNITYKLYKSEIKKIQIQKKYLSKNNVKMYGVSKLIVFFKELIQNIFDDRSRSIDFICLLILLDTFFMEIVLLNYIFIFLAIKYTVLFFGGFYLIYYKKYLNKLQLK